MQEEDRDWFHHMELLLDYYQTTILGHPDLPTTRDGIIRMVKDVKGQLLEREAVRWMRQERESLEDKIQDLWEGVRVVDEDVADEDRGERDTGTAREAVDFEFTMSQMIIVTCESELRESLFESLRENDSNILAVRVIIDDTTNNLPQGLGRPPESSLISTATMLGQVLGSLSALQSLQIMINETIGPTSSLVLATVALGCRQVKKLVIRSTQAEAETLQFFVTYLQRHPTLQAIQILDDTPDDQLFTLVRALPSLKRLEEVNMTWDFPVHTVEAAELLRDVLTMDSIKFVEVNYLTLATEAASRVACAAIAASPMQTLDAYEWSCPVGEMAVLAKALTDSKLNNLFLAADMTSDFYATLGRGLKEATVADTIQEIQLGHISHDGLLALLANAHHLKLRELGFCVVDDQWTIEVDHGIAQLLANNDYLQSFAVSCHGTVGRPPIRSAEILDAVRSGSGSLDQIDLEPISDNPFDHDWVQNVQAGVASNLNRHRRIHGPMFQQLSTAQTREGRCGTLTKSFAAVDNSTRFAFLRGNEWDCREILIQELPGGTSKKRRRSEPACSEEYAIEQQSAKTGRIE